MALEVEDTQSQAEQPPRWYVVHTYSGYENKVRENLLKRIESMDAKDMIFDVVVPTQKEVEIKQGQRRDVERKLFPGYVLVRMQQTDQSWFIVRNTPGVTGFVSSGRDDHQPVPLADDEVDKVLKRGEEETPQARMVLRKGDRVKIIDGPFAEFYGTVDDANQERGRVRVMVSFFGRETPVELDFLQVERI
jgi:transcriptional antiterminator NusG